MPTKVSNACSKKPRRRKADNRNHAAATTAHLNYPRFPVAAVHWPTERQVTAQANVLWLQQERKRLRALYEVLPVGYALMDQYGIIHEANRRFESIIGLSPGLLRKTPFSRLVRRDDIPLLLNHFWLRLPAVK